jgi:hypothetical protein
MDYATIQARISRGYGIAGKKLGPLRDIYRPAPPFSALALSCKVGSTYCALDAAASFGFNRPNEYGDAVWYALIDTSVVQSGDYLVFGTTVHFLAGVQPLLPAFAVECGPMVSVFRPAGNTGVGAQPYGGDIAAAEVEMLTAWPASVLLFGTGRRNEARIPGEATAAQYRCLLPNTPGLTIRDNDIVVTDAGIRYQVLAAELSDLGWRLNMRLANT